LIPDETVIGAALLGESLVPVAAPSEIEFSYVLRREYLMLSGWLSSVEKRVHRVADRARSVAKSGGPTALGRTERLLAGIDIDRQVGLEIGPLDRPLVPRSQGRAIYYADYAPRDTLREKSVNDPNVDCDRIPEIDYIIAPLPKRLDREFDYIIASHVAEHVPDFLGWLLTLFGWLAPGGRVVLAIPDRRHCFDYLRSPSTVGQMLEAFITQRTRPTFTNIYDGFRLAIHFDVPSSWHKEPVPPYEHIYSSKLAFGLAEDAHFSGEYQDCDCWVFTYESFLAAIEEINALGIVNIRVDHGEGPLPGSNEFQVVLCPGG
jgi:SAM-dependent methyltransferase